MIICRTKIADVIHVDANIADNLQDKVANSDDNLQDKSGKY